MKKLLYIANLRLPTEKAYGIQIAKMCEAFASQELDVTLVYPFRKNHLEDDFFSYYSVKRNFKAKEIWVPDFYFPGKLDQIAVNIKDIISAFHLFLYTIKNEADIIYSRDEWPLYFLSFFSAIGGSALGGKKNLVFEAHRYSKSRKLFYKRFKNKNFKVVVITKRLKEDFVKIGFRPENILLAPDSVDLEEFNIDISKEEAKNRMGLPLNRKIVMYTGHLFEWKGADTLLQVAKLISNSQFLISNEDILFVFVGGMEYDVENFRQKAKDEDLKNVLILGHKPHKDIPFFLKAADILVLPNSGKEEISRSYTSPLKLFEYMASGRPIVASALPSIIEIINDKNSVLVKPDNLDDLVKGIKKVLNNNLLGEELAKKALEDVKNYTWIKRAKTICSYFGGRF